MYTLLILSAILFAIVYKYLIKPLKYWANKGAKYEKPKFLFGNIMHHIFQIESFMNVIENIYKNGKGCRYYGMYMLVWPMLMIRDPGLIKKLTIKEGDVFINHTIFSDIEIDPLWSRNLFASKADHWHTLRPALSPTFTTSKIKLMFNLISDCAKQTVEFYLNKKQDVIELEMKELFSRFGNDSIATCAFGLNVDSFRQPNNDFYVKGKEATEFKGWRQFIFMLPPQIMKLFKIKIFSKNVTDFFTKVIKGTMKIRESKSIVRPDMIHLLMQVKKGQLSEDVQQKDDSLNAMQEYTTGKQSGRKKIEITDDDIIAQALVFFFAGFDTTSTLMTFMAYELAKNKDIQDKLYEEVKKTLNKCDGQITYETLAEMKYLDMVVAETLRMWPPNFATDRVSIADYVLEPENPNETAIHLPKGTAIMIPIHALHMDPKNFPNPKTFDPERFNDENKSKIESGSYIPFGVGMRNCIGSRFALMETKILFFYLLTKFEIVPTKKSVIPVVISKKKFVFSAEGGMWLGLKCRK